MRGRFTLREIRLGSSQMRYSPVGPLMVPRSARATLPSLVSVGQAPAGVAVPPEAGGGGGGGGLLTTIDTLSVPGDAMSSAPHPVNMARPQPRMMVRWMVFT